jgi:hypothetical protein
MLFVGLLSLSMGVGLGILSGIIRLRRGFRCSSRSIDALLGSVGSGLRVIFAKLLLLLVSPTLLVVAELGRLV